MLLQSQLRLILTFSLVLAGACAGTEGKPGNADVDEDNNESSADEGDSGTDAEDEGEDEGEDEDEQSEESDPPTPPPKRDASTPDSGKGDVNVDAGKSDADAGTPSKDGGDDEADADAGDDEPDAAPADDAGPSTGEMGDGECCSDGDCTCHGPAPTGLTSSRGPYQTRTHSVSAGCIHYPTNAEGKLSAVAVSDGFLGAGGCNSLQTGGWGPLLASWGIATMIINTSGADQPNVRGRKLTAGVEAFKAENTKSGSPLNGKLSGRYGTMGFSMGGGGTSYASQADKTLKSSIAVMPWGPVTRGIEVPTLVICGSSDTVAPCGSHGNPLFRSLGSTPNMKITVSAGHSGQPSAGRNMSGQVGLAFQKVFLEGDERWLSVLKSARNDGTNIQ